MLSALPQIDRLLLAQVTKLPDWHPALPGGASSYAVYAYLIRHPEGPILVDTGIGTGNEQIDEMYAPVVTDLASALGDVGVAVGELLAVVNTHLHFDHCGQNARTTAPVYVQRAEIEAARQPFYTVAEWAAVPDERLRPVDGEREIADGVRLVPTPGHTPGHQSVLVSSQEGRALIVGQAAWKHPEWSSGQADPANSDDLETAQRSLDRLGAIGPTRVYFSHDAQPSESA